MNFILLIMLMPPTLGDFERAVSPQIWGARGAKSYIGISNAKQAIPYGAAKRSHTFITVKNSP